MMDGLNKYGLGVKYAIIGLVGGAIGGALVAIFGQESGATNFLIFPIAGAVGGYVGGRLRQKRGKED
jgi:hypothetical protein